MTKKTFNFKVMLITLRFEVDTLVLISSLSAQIPHLSQKETHISNYLFHYKFFDFVSIAQKILIFIHYIF